MIHENIRLIRIAKGIKGSHVANTLGMSRSEYHDREVGKVRVGVEEMKVISDALGEGVDIFFDDKLTKSVLRKIKKEVGRNATTRRSKGA